jgi:hypothetical protein
LRYTNQFISLKKKVKNIKKFSVLAYCGKNAQENQSSAEQIDHSNEGIQNNLLQSHFSNSSRSGLPPGRKLRRKVVNLGVYSTDHSSHFKMPFPIIEMVSFHFINPIILTSTVLAQG